MLAPTVTQRKGILLQLAKRLVMLGALLALVLPVSAAFAASATSDGNYQQLKGNKFVVEFHVAKNGKSIDMFSAYTKCNGVPFNPPVTIKITKGGAFNLTGKAKDVLGKMHGVVVHGKFTSAKAAKGTYKIDGPGCKGKT